MFTDLNESMNEIGSFKFLVFVINTYSSLFFSYEFLEKWKGKEEEKRKLKKICQEEKTILIFRFQWVFLVLF